MITNAAVDMSIIEQFKADVGALEYVDRVSHDHGRALRVTVVAGDDGVPRPHHELGELKKGSVYAEDYVVSKLSGGGHAPGEKYTFRLAVSPYCEECGEDYQVDDEGRCSSCRRHRNLLTAEPGETVTVEASGDVFGIRYDPGEAFEASADDNGVLRDESGKSLNDGRYEVVDDDS